MNDKFYKGQPPSCSSDHWIGKATLIGHAGWDSFKFLFFDPDGVLYGAKDGRFYKRAPPTCSDDNWQGSATVIGRSGWSAFQFLFFDPQGTL